MSPKTQTCKSSPKLCLLLKTLLFLLCIYIKRSTAVSISHLGANTDETLVMDAKSAQEGETTFDLRCPVEEAIKVKDSLSKSKQNQSYFRQLKKEAVKKVDVIWLKNHKPLHRENGNLILNQLDAEDDKSIVLLGIGTSDAAIYTCLLNYSNVPREAHKYLQLYPSVSFQLYVNRPIGPDDPPTISHPPANHLEFKGSNVKFTCNRIATLSHQTTYWFKSCPITGEQNQTCIEQFLTDYKILAEGKVYRPERIERYLLKNNNDELNLFNVNETDIGYYGCMVVNSRGIDIRLAKLDFVDRLMESKNANAKKIDESTSPEAPKLYTTSTTPTPPTTTPMHVTTTTTTTNTTRIPATSVNQATVLAASQQQTSNQSWLIAFFGATVLAIFLATCCSIKLSFYASNRKHKKYFQNNLSMPAPIVGNNCQADSQKQHLPRGNCPDIYNIGKTTDGFISGLHQSTGHLLSQSICSQMLNKEKNPSISSNSNSDEASSWGKSTISQGDNSRAFYLHTSNTTATTVPMYDHPPSNGAAQLCGAIVQDACVINPTYGFLRSESDADTWAFPRRNLERLNRIGEGQFGEVWRYKARQNDGNESFVAVKQLRNRAGLGNRDRLELIAEIEIMKLVNDHPNVIKLLNYCADDYEPILLIMEFAEKGKLQTYLRDYRTIRKSYGCVSESSTLTSKELIKFSYHVTKGMEYVSSKGIVHRDLASRNILVSKDNICKVADFGFARRVGDDCAYERTTANAVPVRWMAPEALTENKYTTKSDVFSLGIVLWEIVTLGATPYESLNYAEVIKKVTLGERLEKPVHCKDEFYNIMQQCWLHDPSQRPTFKELAWKLEKLLLSENNYIELDQYPEHAYYNILPTKEKEIVHMTA